MVQLLHGVEFLSVVTRFPIIIPHTTMLSVQPISIFGKLVNQIMRLVY